MHIVTLCGNANGSVLLHEAGTNDLCNSVFETTWRVPHACGEPAVRCYLRRSNPCIDLQICHPRVMRNACHIQQMLAQTVSRMPDGAPEQPVGADAQPIFSHHHGARSTVCRTVTAGRHMQIEKAALERIMAGLDNNIPARKTPLSEDELPLVRGLQLLTMKPVSGTWHCSVSCLVCWAAYSRAVPRPACWRSVEQMWSIQLMSYMLSPISHHFTLHKSCTRALKD